MKGRLLAIALAAFLLRASFMAHGQDLPADEAAAPQTSQASAAWYDPLLGGYFRIYHRAGESVGQPDSFTTFGTFRPFELDDGLIFLDGQVLIDNVGATGGNVGLGRRWLTEDAVLGASLWYDIDTTEFGNTFQQLSLGVERLGPRWDLRANAYFPVSDPVESTGRLAFAAGPLYRGFNIVTVSGRLDEAAMKGGDMEAALRLFDLPAWAYGGWYYFQGGGQSTNGPKGGIRATLSNQAWADLTITHDPQFGTNVYGGLTWLFGGGLKRDPGISPSGRIMQPVQRQQNVVVRSATHETINVLNDSAGNHLTVMHVSSAAAPGGDGSVERPLMSLDDVLALSSPNDIVFVHAGSVFNGQSVTLQPNQRFLGEGIEHRVETQQLGVIVLPRATAGTALPMITNAPGVAIALASGAEVSGFNINGGGGILGTNLTGRVEISRNAIAATGNAFELTSATGGELELAMIGNTFASTTVAGARIDGSAAGSNLTITNFANNTVAAAGADGLSVTAATFDADRATAGIQPVDGGDTTIGEQANTAAVSGDGLRLDQVRGSVAFNHLNIANNGGTGLFVRDADGKPGTFAISNNGGSINTTSGPATDIDPVSVDMRLDHLTSRGSPTHGVNLDRIAGSFKVTGATTITDAAADGIRVINSPAATVGLGDVRVTGTGAAGTFDNATLRFENNPGAVISLRLLEDISTNSASGLIANDSGLLNIDSLTPIQINAQHGSAVDISRTAGNVNGSGLWVFQNLIASGSAGTGVRLHQLPNDFTVTGSTVVIDPQGHGIEIDDSDGRIINLGQATVTGAGAAGAAGDAYRFTNNDSSVISFQLMADPMTYNGAGIVASGENSVVNIKTVGLANITAHGGPAVDISHVRGNVGGTNAWFFDNLTSVDSNRSGVILDAPGNFLVMGATSVQNSANDGLAITFDAERPADVAFNLITIEGAQRGIVFQGAGGGRFTAFGTTTISQSLNSGIEFIPFDAGLAGAKVTFLDLAIEGTTLSDGIRGLHYDGDLSVAGMTIIQNTAGHGINLGQAEAGSVAFNHLIINNAGLNGVNLSSHAGSFAVYGFTSIWNVDHAVEVQSSSADVHFGLTFITDPRGQPVVLNGHSGDFSMIGGSP